MIRYVLWWFYSFSFAVVFCLRHHLTPIMHWIRASCQEHNNQLLNDVWKALFSDNISCALHHVVMMLIVAFSLLLCGPNHVIFVIMLLWCYHVVVVMSSSSCGHYHDVVQMMLTSWHQLDYVVMRLIIL